MVKRQLPLAGAMILLASGISASAAPVEHKIPATEAEFAAQWEVVEGAVDGTWEWVAADEKHIPYARTTAVKEGQQGPSLIYSDPMTLKAGDVVYVQANVSSEHYNDDEWFYIVYGTDKESLQDMPDDTSSFKCWGISGGGVNFQYKPSDTSNKRELTIPADGDYYFGVRSKKGTTNYNVLACAGIKVEKSVNYPQKVTSAKATAAGEGLLEVELSWTWPEKNKDGSAISGPIGANIYRSASSDKADIYCEDSLIATVSGGEAGGKCTFVDNAQNSRIAIAEPGKYFYYIAPFNEQGENSEYTSSTRVDCKWVGEDVKPLNPLTPVARPVGDNIEVSFTKRIEGYNGGWLNPEEFGIMIERQKNGGDFIVVESSYKGESPYLDETLEGPGSYLYRLCAVYKGEKSTEVKSSAIFGGGSFDVPFSADFGSSNDFSLFTILSQSGSYKWSYYSTEGVARFSGGYSEYWSTLVTPPLKLKGGIPYEISFDGWVDELVSGGDDGDDDDDPWDPWGDYYSVSKKTASAPTHKNVVRVLIGQEATDAGLVAAEVVDINRKSTGNVTSKVYITVETDGNYYIGFKAITEGYSDKKYIDNISVIESRVIPAAVADLKAEPNMGENEALVSFTVPSLTNTGAELEEVTKLEVTRKAPGAEDVVVKTLEGDECRPGTIVSFTDALPESGMYSYTAVCLLGEEMSEISATPEVWYGYDYPKTISSFGISVDTEGEAPVLRWSPLTGTQKTVNGGYIDEDNLRYRVYRRSYMNEAGEDDSYELLGEVSEPEFEDLTAQRAAWNKYFYNISVVNGDKEGNRVERTPGMLYGDAVLMPYTHDFSTERGFDLFEGRGWYSEKDNVSGGYTYLANNRGVTEGNEYTVYLPPFRTLSGTGLGCSLKLGVSRVDARYEENLEIYLCTLESEKESLRSEGISEQEAAVIAGQDNRELIGTIPVDGVPSNPSVKEMEFELPAAGRYRLAVRLASPDSKGVHLHSIEMKNDFTVGVREISGNDSEDEAVYYNLQGIRVENPGSGLYIRRVGQKSEKVMIRR